ncbi:hypothetical protein [Yoonia maritima]|uniref:hypothetical protein n=1 Tax=Yoonia maritima TaxID=1435347 RepID=UPI000D1117A9|nr:hypothetical protein [Yoonia maritima]
MTHVLSLESFDDSETDPKRPNPDFQSGFEQGFDVATERARDDETALKEQLVHAIADIEFGFEEARAQLLQSFGPLLSAISSQLLPAMVAASFGPALIDAVKLAVETSTSGGPTLFVHPIQRRAIEQLCEDQKLTIHISDDRTLSVNSAWIDCTGKETFLDADSLIAQINDTLSALTHSDNRIDRHG